MWDMIIRQRPEPLEITLLRYLHTRMELTEKDASHYLKLEKGFKGEQKCDLLLESLPNGWLIIHDLLLECNHSVFQLDSVLIAQETLYLLDVKNYEGDYYIKGDKWYPLYSDKDIKNPLHQLDRAETLLRQLLQELKYKIPIESYLIFINPEFHLYQAPQNPSIIFPAQLNRFLKKLKMKSAKTTERHLKLAQHLVSRHIVEPPYKRLPPYNFDQLKKGIPCPKCHSFYSDYREEELLCDCCGCKEDVETAVIRIIEEFKLLFPDRKITTNTIHEWCGGILSKKTIRRILSRNFKLIRQARASYYVNF
jgi:Nuclease-related domain